MAIAALRIVPVERIDACDALEALQAEVWGSRDTVVPSHQLYVAARYGGTLLAAYDGEQVVGFVYGFPALHGGRLVLHSHMLAVRQAYRDRGVGRALKEAQRERARELGYPAITWTFDPLECRNAYFNLHLLGARARTYYPDFYGPMRDALNQGLPSDRLLAEWDTDPAAAPPRPAEAAGAPAALEAEARPDGLPAPGRALLAAPPPGRPGPAAVRVPVPAQIQAVKAADPHLALAWRLAVRDALAGFLAAGYEAVDFIPPADRERGTGWYVLARGPREGAPDG